MPATPMPRRRRLGNWFLGLAALLLVCGETVFQAYLGRGWLFVLYWGTCFFFTLLSFLVAAVDYVAVRRLARDQQRELIHSALENLDESMECDSPAARAATEPKSKTSPVAPEAGPSNSG